MLGPGYAAGVDFARVLKTALQVAGDGRGVLHIDRERGGLVSGIVLPQIGGELGNSTACMALTLIGVIDLEGADAQLTGVGKGIAVKPPVELEKADDPRRCFDDVKIHLRFFHAKGLLDAAGPEHLILGDPDMAHPLKIVFGEGGEADLFHRAGL